MELKKPELTIEGDKVVVSWKIVDLDMDNDGKKSISFGVYGEMDKAETANEVLQKILSSGQLPEAIKKLLGAA